MASVRRTGKRPQVRVLPTSVFPGTWLLVLKNSKGLAHQDRSEIRTFAKACLGFALINAGSIAKFTGDLCLMRLEQPDPHLIHSVELKALLERSAAVLVPLRTEVRIDLLRTINPRAAALGALLGPLDMIGHPLNLAFRLLEMCNQGTLAIVEDNIEHVQRIRGMARKMKTEMSTSAQVSEILCVNFLKGLHGTPIYFFLMQTRLPKRQAEEENSDNKDRISAGVHIAVDVVSSVERSQRINASGATEGLYIIAELLDLSSRWDEEETSEYLAPQILRCTGDQIQLCFFGDGSNAAAQAMLKKYRRHFGQRCRYLIQNLSDITYVAQILREYHTASLGASTHLGDIRSKELECTSRILGYAAPGHALLESEVAKNSFDKSRSRRIKFPRLIDPLTRDWYVEGPLEEQHSNIETVKGGRA